MATPVESSGTIKRTILQAIPIPELPGWEHRMVLLEYPPGATAQVHYHPVPGLKHVCEGIVISQWEGGEEAEIFQSGSSFIDFANKLHLRVSNASQTDALKIVACYVIRVGEPNVVNA